MPLTPTDVANKQFRIAFRGYSLDEVDAFLDEVETELSRLLRLNADGPGRGGAGTTAQQVLAASDAGDGPAGAERSGTAPAVGTSDAAPPAEATPAPPTPLRGLEGQEAALRTLLLAQRTADEAVAEARAEAEQLVNSAREASTSTLGAARQEATTTLTSARAEAAETLGSAREEAETTRAAAKKESEAALAAAKQQVDTTLTSARKEAEATLTAARREAETTLAAARAKAAGIEEEVAARIHAATGNLDAERRDLEQRVEELRSFEREYRTRLKAYLENQLRDLDNRAGPDDASSGVPAAARASAVQGGGPSRPGAGGAEPATADGSGADGSSADVSRAGASSADGSRAGASSAAGPSAPRAAPRPDAQGSSTARPAGFTPRPTVANPVGPFTAVPTADSPDDDAPAGGADRN